MAGEAKIVETKVTSYGVDIKLSNGVSFSVSVNPDYLHLHFSGTKVPMIVSSNVYSPEIPSLTTSNFVEIKYEPRNG